MDSLEEMSTRLGRTSEALRKCEERALAGQFALEIMHEVRNPLDALGYLLHLAQDEDHLGEVRKLLAAANEQMSTIHQIADQTLKLARPLHSPKAVDLTELVEAALRIHHRRIEGQKIHLVRDFAKDVVAEVYTGEILQVVSNLLANAIEAMPEGGTVCLRLRKRNETVQVLVADSGHGMKREHLDRLFEPFFSTKTDRGNGLGLALSKKIVERHSGRITARSSTRPGRSGTAFRITLPHSYEDSQISK